MSSCSTNTCGIGGWGGPLPGDPDNNSILSATPAFGGIDVSWSFPETNPQAVAHTLLYRGLVPEFTGAINRSVVAGNFFYDKIDTATRYYYWIRIISVNGTIGELIGPATAIARPTIQDTIEQLTGMIDAGLLSQSLKAKLDEISILNTNLLNEIFSRENGEVSLAQAMNDVNAGIAQAMTFIHQEINSRTSADSAIAEQLNLVAVTLGNQYAAVILSTTAKIDNITGEIDAMFTAQVNVNGLIGGFGIHNNGRQVDAGFDVDTFWVGRTNANKRKPFIIVGDETFINEAVINRLTFSKLRDESGSFVVENGRVKADYLRVATASIDDLAVVTAKIGDAQVNNAKFGGDLWSNDFVWGSAGWLLSRSGYFQCSNIYARGDIQATSITADTITARNVVSNSLNQFFSTTSGSVSFDIPLGAQALRAQVEAKYYSTGGKDDTRLVAFIIFVYLDGVMMGSVESGDTFMLYNVAAGAHTITFMETNNGFPSGPYGRRVNVEVLIR